MSLFVVVFRIFRFLFSLIYSGLSIFCVTKLFALSLYEPELLGSNTDGPSIFVYAMY